MPEGPSIAIAAEELQLFAGKRVLSVEGNSKQPIEKMQGQMLRSIFSHGKYLNFQFDEFALRIHFMLFGSMSVDVPRENRDPRLMIRVKGHSVYFYACSVKFAESPDLAAELDFRTDLMSPQWDRREVLRRIRATKDTTVDDLLMNQEIFTGLGNIMKNETLWLQRMRPQRAVKKLTPFQLGRLISEAHTFAQQFYEWKKRFVLKKNLQIYRKGACPRGCKSKIVHAITGKRQRMSHYCPVCQK